MRIAYIGNFKHSHCTEVHLKAEMESLGHRVMPVQEDELWIPQADSAIRNLGAELVLYTATWPWNENMGDEWGAWFAQLEASGIPTASFTLDLFFGIRDDVIRRHPFFRTGRMFSADGGHQAEWDELGIEHHWIRPGMFSQEVGLADPNPRYGTPVAFVGHSPDGYHQQWPWRQQLFDALRAEYGDNFMHYGPGSVQGTVRGAQLAQVYATAKAVAGDSLILGPSYWSDRVYETVGRGGLLVHPWIEELVDEFAGCPTPQWYKVGEPDTLLAEIDALLSMTDDERMDLRLQGVEFVRRHCTYRNRMAELLEVVQSDLA